MSTIPANINFTSLDRERMDRLAEYFQTNRTDIIRKALSTLVFILDNGGQVIVIEKETGREMLVKLI
jgi:hypothetical protein